MSNENIKSRIREFSNQAGNKLADVLRGGEEAEQARYEAWAREENSRVAAEHRRNRNLMTIEQRIASWERITSRMTAREKRCGAWSEMDPANPENWD